MIKIIDLWIKQAIFFSNSFSYSKVTVTILPERVAFAL